MPDANFFDPYGGIWSKGESNQSEELKPKEPTEGNESTKSTSQSATKPVTDKKTSSKKSKREWDEKEYSVLVGSFNPVIVQMKYRPRMTLQLEGLGKVLSGKYYISSVDIEITNSGLLTQTIGVRKSEFGDKMKVAQKNPEQHRPERIV